MCEAWLQVNGIIKPFYQNIYLMKKTFLFIALGLLLSVIAASAQPSIQSVTTSFTPVVQANSYDTLVKITLHIVVSDTNISKLHLKAGSSLNGNERFEEVFNFTSSNS